MPQVAEEPQSLQSGLQHVTFAEQRLVRAKGPTIGYCKGIKAEDLIDKITNKGYHCCKQVFDGLVRPRL